METVQLSEIKEGYYLAIHSDNSPSMDNCYRVVSITDKAIKVQYQFDSHLLEYAETRFAWLPKSQLSNFHGHNGDFPARKAEFNRGPSMLVDCLLPKWFKF